MVIQSSEQPLAASNTLYLDIVADNAYRSGGCRESVGMNKCSRHYTRGLLTGVYDGATAERSLKAMSVISTGSA